MSDDFYDPMSIEGGLLYDDVSPGWAFEPRSKKRSRYDDDFDDDDEFDDDEDDDEDD